MPYALGGSTSFFWVAQRSGSFEKYGVKVLPIFMRGGREAVQALISRDVLMLQQGSSGVILAWAQGAKDLVVLKRNGKAETDRSSSSSRSKRSSRCPDCSDDLNYLNGLNDLN